jgi:hypothetical protein
MGAIIFVLFISLLSTIGKLPITASEIKELNTDRSAVSDEVISELEQQLVVAKPKADTIREYFPDESGVVDFIGEIDKLKAQGIIDSFTFASGEAVNDKTKSKALPFLVEVSGDKSKVSRAVESLQGLPYMIRAVNVEIVTLEVTETEDEEGNTVQVPDTSGNNLKLKYGGLIYVDEDFGEN